MCGVWQGWGLGVRHGEVCPGEGTRLGFRATHYYLGGPGFRFYVLGTVQCVLGKGLGFIRATPYYLGGAGV